MSGSFKKTILCTGLLFICANLCLAEPQIPLPGDAVKVNEKTTNAGFLSVLITYYNTSLSPDKITVFYKKEMEKAGWDQRRPGVFMKDDYIVSVIVNPSSANKTSKTRFIITTNRVPSPDEILASRKETPDEVDFMPVYPGSMQNFLMNLPSGGISASYITDDDIKDVVFFYKSGMLRYGWGLQGEPVVKVGELECPGCLKGKGSSSKLKASTKASATTSNAELSFTRGNGDKCKIMLFQSSAQLMGSGAADNKTNILVTYNEAKKKGIR
jgi:hypothetical protein